MNTTKRTLWAALLTLSIFAGACVGEGSENAAENDEDAASDPGVDGSAPSSADSPEPSGEGASVATVEPGSAGSAVMGRASWSSGYVQAAILRDLLVEAGYTVTEPADSQYSPDHAYHAMATGEIDFWANSWYPGHLSWWKSTLPDGTEVGDSLTRVEGSLMPGGGRKGMLVTKSWAEENGVTTLDQINEDEALWSQLDSDENGKGEFYGCSEERICDDIMASQIVFAGWDNLEQIRGSDDEMFADFLMKAQNGDPAIMYTSTPTPYLAQARPGDVTMWLSVNNDSVLDDSNPLNLDNGEAYCQRCGDTIGYQGLGEDVCLFGPDGCQLGWEASDIEITANEAWLDANPVAAELFRQFTPPLIDMAVAGIALDETDGSTAAVNEIAALWIADNRETADAWVAAAVAAG